MNKTLSEIISSHNALSLKFIKSSSAITRRQKKIAKSRHETDSL